MDYNTKGNTYEKNPIADAVENCRAAMKLVPGMSPDILDYLYDKGYKAVYIEAFGRGGIPFLRRNMAEAVNRVMTKGMIVVVGSQCLYEGRVFEELLWGDN